MTDRVSSFQSGPSTTFYVEGDLLSQSIAGNYSVVRCYLRAKNGPGGTTGSSYGGAGFQAGTIAGVKEFARRNASSNFLPSGYGDNQQRWRVGPYDVQVPHNSDGTRDPIRFGMVLDYGAVNATVFSGDMALPTIPRATKAQFRIGSTPVTAFDIGAPVTVYLPRASSSFTHDITYRFGGDHVTVANGAGVSTTWTPPMSLLDVIPDELQNNGTLYVTTKSGSTVIGTSTTPFTLRAPASAVPTISAINVGDDNSTVASAIGGFVQGQSRLKATIVAAGVGGSTITSAVFSVDGQSAASGETVPLSLTGARAVAASVTDSRGRVGTANGNVTVLPYVLPQIANFLVERATSSGLASPNGTYLRMTLNAAISSLIVGTQKNSAILRVFTRPRGTSAWTARNVITAPLAYNTSVLITGGGIYAASTAYDVRVEVSDKLQKSEDYWSVSTAGAILDSNATQQALGKMVETAGPTTQIQGPARVYGVLDIDGRKAIDAGDVATQAEVDAGTDPARIVTPKTLRDRSYAPYSEGMGLGSSAANNGSSGTTYWDGGVTITLPSGRFSQAPIITATAEGAGQVLTANIISRSETAFVVRTIRFGAAVAAGTPIHWRAAQMTAGSASG